MLNVWQILDIEPTTSLATIRRAYAVKLKVTRPDDDAAAYQALNEAYKDAIEYAKYTAITEAETPPATADAEPALPENIADTLPAIPEPEDLVQQILTCYQTGGEAGLMAWWPDLERLLHIVPLNRADEYMIELVEMVTDNPALPWRFVEQLQIHYGWGADFRLEEILGYTLRQRLHVPLNNIVFEKRIAAMKERLDQECIAEAAKIQREKREAVFERHNHLMKFIRFAKTATQQRLALFAVLAGPQWLFNWQVLDSKERETLGIDDQTKTSLNLVLQKATQVRTQLVCCFVALGICINLAIGGQLTYPGMLFLLAVSACHYLPIAHWLETRRLWWNPPSLAAPPFTQSADIQFSSRVQSFFFCFIAYGLAISMKSGLSDYETLSFWRILFIALFLLSAWLSQPIEDTTAQKTSLMMFFLFFFLLHEVNYLSFLTVLSLSAFWNCAAYATRILSLKITIWCIWLFSTPVIFLGGVTGLLGWLGFGFACLLYEFAQRQSVAYVTGLLLFAVASFPNFYKKLQLLWIIAVAIIWLGASIGMRWQADRMLRDVKEDA